ncbi:preprotein translocase subunit SecA [Patescibacteria group bacterium]
MALFKKTDERSSARVLKQYTPLLNKINDFAAEFEKASDDDLKKKAEKLKNKIQQKPDDLKPFIKETYALVREVAKRTISLRPFDVQVIGGLVLNEGKIAEMKTGEGKTLVATMPVVLNAFTGRGVHVVTVNEYLASRDAEWMSPVYEFLGLTVGVTCHGQTPQEKQEAYEADITYGTNNEFGFDYLRDNMAGDLRQVVQRGHNFAIVDEVDSILIDEARTPLIISAPAEEGTDQYKQFAQIAKSMQENVHYNKDEKMRASALTQEGISFVEEKLNRPNMYADASGVSLIHHIEQALRAHALFQRDKDYVVKDGEVMIVDQFTGRLMPGRRYSEGLHQAIEAKENVEVQRENRTLATITFQNYFRLYEKLSGMTGTAATEVEEFAKIYGLEVDVIPTNKPMVRNDLADRIYSTEEGKFNAVVAEIKARHEKGQPVLVGTIAIEKSEVLSELLVRDGVPHEILNAKNHEREATIVANAGQKGAVTISTNMAGRGTDIKLGEGVVEVGGLHVLGTERHESRRIDNQLRGRSGRQGDAGSSQFYVSLEDDLMRIFGSSRVQTIMQRLGLPEDQPIENRMISRALESAQKKVEGNNFDVRKHLVEFDDVINKQREIIYKRRRDILKAWEKTREEIEGVPEEDRKYKDEELVSLREQLLELIDDEIEQVVLTHTSNGPEWNVEEIIETLATIFTTPPPEVKEGIEKIADDQSGSEAVRRDKLIQFINDALHAAYDQREIQLTPQVCRQVERVVLLKGIDNIWVEHLDAMDRLRESVRLRGYGQRDPLVEYKKESYRLFNQLLDEIRNQVVYGIFKVTLAAKNQKTVLERGRKYAEQAGREKADGKKKSLKSTKVGRNDPCPCGSGKKSKKCCGE